MRTNSFSAAIISAENHRRSQAPLLEDSPRGGSGVYGIPNRITGARESSVKINLPSKIAF